jgi:hypothetical protein
MREDGVEAPLFVSSRMADEKSVRSVDADDETRSL